MFAASSSTHAVAAWMTKNGTDPMPNVAAATCAMRLGCGWPWQSKPTRLHGFSAYCTPETSPITVSPEKSAMAIPPMSTSVICALRIFGLRKAGTPLDTASTPVRAEHPLENARSTSRISAACVSCSPCTVYSALEAIGGSPSSVRTRPTTIMTATEPTKR